MPKLNPEELRTRLRFDWTIAQRMDSPLVVMQAYRTMTDLDRRANPVLRAEDGHQACFYLVKFRIRSLSGEGVYHDRFDVAIGLLAGGDYPFSEPACCVTSRPIPWSPHFLPGKGAICLGGLWAEGRGTTTIGHLVVHVCKLINFDEPDREPAYGGWNAAAVTYWRTVLKRQPITPGLVYPTLPAEITHAIPPANRPLFRPAAAAGSTAAASHFRPGRR